MTVTELIHALQTMPPHAVVLFEGDLGYDSIGGIDLHNNQPHAPDEVILVPSFGD